MASIEERFQAAVNVIKGLPKNGPYQPSSAMMLKFYGYFKQATEGPCYQKKPGFWDIVRKAKWDAWNSNQHLTKEQAMKKYVEDLREIIETMSFTENVQNFVGSINGLDNINLDELEMVVPGMRELAESHPNSPFNSRTHSPQHGIHMNGSEEEFNDVPMKVNHILNGHENGVIESFNPSIKIKEENLLNSNVTNHTYAMSNGDQSDDEYGDPLDLHNDLTEIVQSNTELLKTVQVVVLRMNSDMQSVNNRIMQLERSLLDIRTLIEQRRKTDTTVQRQYPKWWPFKHISPTWFIILMLWPILMPRIARMLFFQKVRNKS